MIVSPHPEVGCIDRTCTKQGFGKQHLNTAAVGKKKQLFIA